MGEHEPVLSWAGRHGSWCHCTCRQWRSRTYTTITGAHIEFGKHLLAVRQQARLAALIRRAEMIRAARTVSLPEPAEDDSPIRCVTCGSAQREAARGSTAK